MDLREFIQILSTAPVYRVKDGDQKGLEYVAVSLKSMDHIIEWLEETANLVEAMEDLDDELPDEGTSIH